MKLKHHNLLSTTNCKKKTKTQKTQHAVQSPSAYPVELVNKNMTEAQPGLTLTFRRQYISSESLENGIKRAMKGLIRNHPCR